MLEDLKSLKTRNDNVESKIIQGVSQMIGDVFDSNFIKEFSNNMNEQIEKDSKKDQNLNDLYLNAKDKLSNLDVNQLYDVLDVYLEFRFHGTVNYILNHF
ncbi:MAG TPA: hypothetical protein VMW74_07285 [Nitrosopumilaceae archaeon]|nr:hypothetical protein [Nitrosopumilaceae archaeon]